MPKTHVFLAGLLAVALISCTRYPTVSPYEREWISLFGQIGLIELRQRSDYLDFMAAASMLFDNGVKCISDNASSCGMYKIKLRKTEGGMAIEVTQAVFKGREQGELNIDEVIKGLGISNENPFKIKVDTKMSTYDNFQFDYIVATRKKFLYVRVGA